MTLRLLPGRVMLRKREMTTSVLWTPQGNPRQQKIHRGTVLDVGPPARTRNGKHDVPHDFAPGDDVLFVWALALEDWRTLPEDAVIVTQEEVVAVIEKWVPS